MKNVLRIVPPLCLSMADVDTIFSAFERSFQDLLER